MNNTIQPNDEDSAIEKEGNDIENTVKICYNYIIEKLIEEVPKWNEYNFVTSSMSHDETERVNDVFRCEQCEYNAEDIQNIESHMETYHGPKPLVEDINTSTASDLCQDLTCRICDFEGGSTTELKKHIEELNCPSCKFSPKTKEEQVNHIQTMHKSVSVDIQMKDQIVFACELCEYTCILTIKLKHHMNKKHPQMTDISAYSCRYVESQRV